MIQVHCDLLNIVDYLYTTRTSNMQTHWEIPSSTLKSVQQQPGNWWWWWWSYIACPPNFLVDTWIHQSYCWWYGEETRPVTEATFKKMLRLTCSICDREKRIGLRCLFLLQHGSLPAHTHTLSYFARQDFVFFSSLSFRFSSSACVRLKGCLKDEKNVTYSPPVIDKRLQLPTKMKELHKRVEQGGSNENIYIEKKKMMKKK